MNHKIGQHRGVDVFVDETGTFVTEPDSAYGFLQASTLTELRKLIDKAGAMKPGPAEAFLIEDSYNPQKQTIAYCKCGVIIPSRYGGPDVWVTRPDKSRSKEQADRVYERTERNLELAGQYLSAMNTVRLATKGADKLLAQMVSVATSHGPKDAT